MIQIAIKRTGTTGSLFEPLRYDEDDPWRWPVMMGSTEIGRICADDDGEPWFYQALEVRLTRGDLLTIAYEMEFMRDCLNRRK